MPPRPSARTLSACPAVPDKGTKTGTDLARCDTYRGTWRALILWGLPALVAGGALVAASWNKGLLWLAGAAFAVMGLACLINAARCRRLHCFITGPYYFLLALGAWIGFFYDPIGEYHSTLWLLLALAASPLFIWLPERLARRKYW